MPFSPFAWLISGRQIAYCLCHRWIQEFAHSCRDDSAEAFYGHSAAAGTTSEVTE
jgi:hypothetical protein